MKRERKERERKQTFAFGGVQKEKKAEKAETPQRDRKKREKNFFAKTRQKFSSLDPHNWKCWCSSVDE